MLKLTSGVNSPHQDTKYIHVNMCQQTVFEVELPGSPRPESIRFSFVWIFENSTLFSSNLKLTDI